MHVAQAAAMAAALLSMALAGCSGGGSSDGFAIKGPSSDGTYTFTASGSADNYTWDLGDHLTKAYGKKVEHKYDFANGVVPVVLTTVKGDKRDEHRKEITLGTGANENAAFVLEGETNWTVLGETFKLSAHRSTDPDGDPLRYTWSCQRVSDAVRQTPHVHAGFGGVPFATPPAGAVTAIDAQGPLPEADRTVDGDFCEALGPGGRPSLDTTIAGTFTKSGVYDIYLLASDPVHPTTSGKYRIVATPPGEKPNETYVIPIADTFTAGGNGSTHEALCTQLGQCGETLDQSITTFSLSLLGQSGYMALEYDAPASQVTCELKRGTAPVAMAVGPGQNVTLDAAQLKAGTYTSTCTVDVASPASPVAYDLVVVIDLDMDPFKVY